MPLYTCLRLSNSSSICGRTHTRCRDVDSSQSICAKLNTESPYMVRDVLYRFIYYATDFSEGSDIQSRDQLGCET